MDYFHTPHRGDAKPKNWPPPPQRFGLTRSLTETSSIHHNTFPKTLTYMKLWQPMISTEISTAEGALKGESDF